MFGKAWINQPKTACNVTASGAVQTVVSSVSPMPRAQMQKFIERDGTEVAPAVRAEMACRNARPAAPQGAQPASGSS